MASAPPADFSTTLMGYPAPPSYEESLNSNLPYPPAAPGYAATPAGYAVTPAGYAPAPTGDKASVASHPTQGYNQMYQATSVQQTQPVANPAISVQTVYVQPGQIFGSVPVQVFCHACTQNVITRIEYSSGTLTWLSCAGLAIFGCIYGCCLIPFCLESLKDVVHRCPNCSTALGVHRRL
ncbi:hypothetical protein DNTS_003228 [Danionella cerebrum]|uniref:LITAF domain-containing protein n=1 Tax=Danionella cerebrum TaxID=2873325 RepID=A0A553RQ29_9TELE|nr:hypothetical protein DNTS_003228 [Danionella translucida]